MGFWVFDGAFWGWEGTVLGRFFCGFPAFLMGTRMKCSFLFWTFLGPFLRFWGHSLLAFSPSLSLSLYLLDSEDTMRRRPFRNDAIVCLVVGCGERGGGG